MAASQSYSQHGSSVSFMSGELSAISSVEMFADSFVDSLITAIDEAVDDASTALQQAAQAEPSWSEYAPLLTVEAERGVLHYTHTGDAETDYDIMALEFGAFETPPNPVLRTFAEKNSKEIAQRISNHISMESSFV